MKGLVSWQLWQRIQRQQRDHPLYQRTVHLYGSGQGWVALVGVELTALFFYTPLVFVTFPFIPFVLMLSNTVNGLALALKICAILHHERQTHRLDLIALIPCGKREAVWMMVLAAVHHTDAYHNLTRWRHYVRYMLPVGAIVYLMLLILNVLSGGVGIAIRNGLFFLILLPALATLLFSWDSTQAIVTAMLSGLFASSATANHTESRLLAGAVFIGVQLLYGALVWLLSLPLQWYSAPYYHHYPAQWTPFLFRTALYLVYVCVVFIGLREIIIRQLWWRYQRNLQA